MKLIQTLIKAQPVRCLTTSSKALAGFTPDSEEGTFALTRKFHGEETYRPRDLNEENYTRYREQQRFIKRSDMFEKCQTDPIKEYRNISMLSSFITSLGKIMPQSQTGLNKMNQRKLSKSIKRARAMGLMAYTCKSEHYF